MPRGRARARAAPPSPTDNTPSPSPPPGEAEALRASTTKRRRSAPAPTPRLHLPPGADPRLPAPGWHPPASPASLIEEALYTDPWRLLVACVLLNKATARAVRRALGSVFAVVPTPDAAAATDPATLATVLRPLGLQRRRAATLIALGREFGRGGWSDPASLPGVGPYAAAAYWIFCAGQWRAFAESEGGVPPQDKDLARYVAFLEATDGAGAGFEREAIEC